MLLMLRLFFRCDKITCCNAEADLNYRSDGDLQGFAANIQRKLSSPQNRRTENHHNTRTVIVSNGFISKVTPVDQDITYTAPNLNIPPTPNSIRLFICSFQTRKLGNGPSAASQYSHRAVKIQAISKVVDMGRQVPVLVPSTCHQKCDSGLQTKSSTSQGIILTTIAL